MKKLTGFFLLLLSLSAQADHITGGQMFYRFISTADGFITYHITMKLYMRCNSGRQFNNPTYLSVFSKRDNSRVNDYQVSLGKSEIISLKDTDPCISNPPEVCYEVGYYDADLRLPILGEGYIIAGQVNFRIAGISNLEPGYSQIGATYTTELPGSILGPDALKNNSAVFTGSDLVVVCANNPFSYSFAATDPDKDSVSYYFCGAYRSSTGPSVGGNLATPPMSPPYTEVPYGNGFFGGEPLGGKVNINHQTGLITGIAPEAGVYVVTVCADEFRNGKLLGTQRKDLQISITSCTLTAALLPDEYQLCRDTKTIRLANESYSTQINDYRWEILDAKGKSLFTSKEPTPSYTFPDTGMYQARLTINPGQRCTDSTSAPVRVYPGFKPAFTYDGICFTKPTLFTDATTSVYGLVNSWKWTYTDNNKTDSSKLSNFQYTFLSPGTHSMLLTVGDSKGCRDTITKSFEIYEKPPADLAFRDTLICPPDLLQLKANGTGSFAWSPASAFANPTTQSPFVSPLVTTRYYVDFEKDGCKGRDSVLVRVATKVDLALKSDTTVCVGDVTRLNVVSNGLTYQWTPGTALDNPRVKSPVTSTNIDITYTVLAKISQCEAKAAIRIRTLRYPSINAGPDTLICFNSVALLHATTSGNKYRWLPDNTIDNPAGLNTTVHTGRTRKYIFQAIDENGCPRPVYDTVEIGVMPQIRPEITHDTAVTTGQQLQLHAGGGTHYVWSPAFGLSDYTSSDPVVVFSEPIESFRYQVNISDDAGCMDSATMNLKVFATSPRVFVPTGFTPNGDGKNDLLRPIAVGIKEIKRFAIFNRYGQQVFFTTVNGKGWDGRVNGVAQQTGAYVWMVQATDYKGQAYVQTGTATLIR